MVPVWAALIGLLVGPLLRRAVDQVPGRHPMFRGDGGVALRGRMLVPVVSWFDAEPSGSTAYRGSPDDRIEGVAPETIVARWRPPAIDLGAAMVFALLAHRIGWTASLPSFLMFGAALVVVTVIDIDHYRIPDRIVFPTLAVCTALLVAAVASDDLTGVPQAAAVGAGAYFAFLFVFFFVWPRGMGFGDVKLALVLGMHLGWAGALVGIERGYDTLVYGIQLVLMGALIGSLLGAVIGIGVLVLFRKRGAFPFGPSLCLGALTAIVFSSWFTN